VLALILPALILQCATSMFGDTRNILSKMPFFIRPKPPISSEVWSKNCAFRFFVQNAKFRDFVRFSYKTNLLCRYSR